MILLALLATTAHATDIGTSRMFGLGIQLGAPSALTGKIYLGGRTNALDFALGAYYYGYGYYYNSFWGQVAYHWHVVELTSGGGVAIPFRVGVGGFFGNSHYSYWHGRYSDLTFGARVPLGLDFDLESAPVQFYVEVAPELVIVPGPFLAGDGGIGVRYYF